MASIEARGFVNKVTTKEYSKGSLVKFDLAVSQKRKDKTGQEVKETLYFHCVDFDGKDAPDEGEYIGVTGYLTLSTWQGGKDGKGGINVDVTVKSYEKLPQRDSGSRPAAKNDAIPNDPFALAGGE